MKTILRVLAVSSLLFLITSSVYADKKDPVGVLFQAQGKVEYSKNGKSWKDVRSSKFLFSGYQIRTGSDSNAKVTLKESGVTMNIGPDSLIEVASDNLNAKSGTLAAAEDSSKLMSGLMNKFSKAQSYTTVRRSHKQKEVKITAVRELALTDEYPDMVWESVGSEYSYQLQVGDQTYDVPATTEPVVRARIKPFSGEQEFKIRVLKGSEVVDELEATKSSGKDSSYKAVWISGQQKSDISAEIGKIQQTFGKDSFMLGSLFEKQEMWVAAMDQYRRYLNENPDELEMTPYLFRVYKKLKLETVYKKELEAWKDATME